MEIKELTNLEEALLGTILAYPQETYKLKELSVENFSLNTHKEIFTAISSCYEDRVSFDYKIIWNILNQKDSKISEDKILSLIDNCSSPNSINRYVEILLTQNLRKKAKNIFNDASEKIADPDNETYEVIKEVHSKILELSKSSTKRKNLINVYNLLIESIEEISDFNSGDKSKYPVIPTGFIDLDDTIGGIPYGELTNIFARTGVGKTTFALELALKTSIQGFHNIFYELELKDVHVGRKVLSRLSASPNDTKGVNVSDLFRVNALKEGDMEKLSEVISRFNGDDFPLWITDDPQTSTADIRADIEEMLQKKGRCDMVVVDSASLMRFNKRGNLSRVEELDLIVKDLREIAKESNVAMVNIAQANRQSEQRANKRPNLGDIRESGAFEQESSIVLGLYRDEMYDPDSEYQGLMEILPLKHRFGGGNESVYLRFDGEYGRFLNTSIKNHLK